MERLKILFMSRIGFDNDPKVLSFIDPPGGPFIHVGDIIEGKRISGIEDYDSYIIIKLEEA